MRIFLLTIGLFWSILGHTRTYESLFGLPTQGTPTHSILATGRSPIRSRSWDGQVYSPYIYAQERDLHYGHH
jgi:hypothetical protein